MDRKQVLASVLLSFIAARAMTQEHQHGDGEKLGEVHFAVACSHQAQDDFDRAVSLLHSFQFSRATHENWVRVGQACQRFSLQATALGLKLAFINQPVEVASLQSGLAALAGHPGRRPDILMRFGYGPDVPMSPRRPMSAVIDA